MIFDVVDRLSKYAHFCALKYPYTAKTIGITLQSEVVNQFLETYLHGFVGDKTSSCSLYLPWAEYSYNTSYHPSLKMSHFEVVHDRPPLIISSYVKGITYVTALEETP
ncbi:uncharacterized protein [Aristolochia californica]|uniref:uncharacterized protein n=1 Tax=Aristolochia californica TaxID=171875 RepID=UPI0035E3A844